MLFNVGGRVPHCLVSVHPSPSGAGDWLNPLMMGLDCSFSPLMRTSLERVDQKTLSLIDDREEGLNKSFNQVSTGCPAEGALWSL